MFATNLPAIHMRKRDVAAARACCHRDPAVARFLAGGVGRARWIDSDEPAFDFVTMNSWVVFRCDVTGGISLLKLVYPTKAGVAPGQISVMTPTGAALIGLSEDQSIEWRSRDGTRRAITVLMVLPRTTWLPLRYHAS